VISGPLAQYKGTGAVNGIAGCSFMLTATDGDVNGGGGVGEFRIVGAVSSAFGYSCYGERSAELHRYPAPAITV